MQLYSTSTEYVYIPVKGPVGVDLTQFAIDIAFEDEQQGEPEVTDWKVAAWADPGTGTKEARLLVTAGDYPPGSYVAWVRVHASPELPVIQSGRLRVGAL